MWFRFYDDTPDDPKLDGFSNDQKWLWAVVLCLASRSPVRGRLLLPPDEPLPMDSYVKRTGMTPEAIDHTLEAFRKREMLARDGPVWVVQNWDKRQFESDTSAERTRKYRERKRKQAPPSDGKDTSPKRDSDVTVTPSDNRLQSTEPNEVVVVMAPNPAKAECLTLVNRHFPKWVFSGEKYKEFLDYEDKLPWALLLKAVQTTMAAGKTSLPYCLGICEKWAGAELKTLEDVDAYEKRRETGRKPQGPQTGSNNTATSQPYMEGLDLSHIKVGGQ